MTDKELSSAELAEEIVGLIDAYLGDTDPSDPEHPLVLACQRAVKLQDRLTAVTSDQGGEGLVGLNPEMFEAWLWDAYCHAERSCSKPRNMVKLLASDIIHYLKAVDVVRSDFSQPPRGQIWTREQVEDLVADWLIRIPRKAAAAITEANCVDLHNAIMALSGLAND